MEYYKDKLCLTRDDIISSGAVGAAGYDNWVRRGVVKIARHGRGRGSYALVEADSLPASCRAKMLSQLPAMQTAAVERWLERHTVMDPSAEAYYSNFDNTGGSLLPAERIRQLSVSASVLNACGDLFCDQAAVASLVGPGGHGKWGVIGRAAAALCRKLGGRLPGCSKRFREKMLKYNEESYRSLVSRKLGNGNARKVDVKKERLLVSLACLPNRPYGSNVRDMYNMFMAGELDVFDKETGELYNPKDYMRHGEAVTLSANTVNNYLNLPKNRVIIDKALMSYTSFMHGQMPHVHRHAPQYSLSKVSFDDRDLPRKLKDTKQRPKAYYAYDVASQCVIGVAYNRSKNIDLVTECFRDMFRLLDSRGWGVPAQIEVENHLMSQWKDSFLKAGTMFPFVRFCAPMNSQEKYAEPMNGAKKRAIEHRNHLGIGRFYAKNRHYQVEARKVFDEKNDTYEDREYYSWEELIADDRRDVWEFNHSLHPDQARYPGMTRWDVLEANINPELKPADRRVLARYIGEHVETTVRRNSYCRVCGKDLWLSSTSVIEKLAPNNWQVDAYYIPQDDGTAGDVYIWQDSKYIDKLQDVGTFNTADCEQTADDKAIMDEQQKKIAKFNSWVKANAAVPVGVLARHASKAVAETKAEVLPEPEEAEPDYTALSEDYAQKAINTF